MPGASAGTLGLNKPEETIMKQSTLYFVLCIPGILVPFTFLIGFFGIPQATISLFFTSIFVNHVSSAVAGDLFMSALVFFTFLFYEGSRLNIKNLWLFVFATLFIGLSLGLPLFLYFRAKKLEQNSLTDQYGG